MKPGLDVAWLGRRDYDETSRLQSDLVEKRRRGEIDDLLLVLEHPPTYTCGRRTRPGDLPQSREWYRDHGIEVADTPRGGQVTYHGPGQLVIYPIIDLRSIGDQPAGAERADVAGFVSTLEKATIETLRVYLNPDRLSGSENVVDDDKNRPGSLPQPDRVGTIEGLTGVWVSAGPSIPVGADAASMAADVATGRIAKIGSIGLRISRGISSHGLSLNVTCDLEPFASITACGLESCRMTSIFDVSGKAPAVREVGEVLTRTLADRLQRDPRAADPAAIGFSPAPVPTA